jgi:hypothetical protein
MALRWTLVLHWVLRTATPIFLLKGLLDFAKDMANTRWIDKTAASPLHLK